ncbi:potassium transporter TrkA [Ornatilinea apprima]|uniref:Trk system potassium uptake protein TrkA n=1 Tax=Ornatilinea apprima TaxID=1134406 RepID=A0A0P6XLQ2_9CHLR|nr:NAD-binding protein [Ornatilinea apprima]KPL76087.1 potassium transporter TrkA [Ornatilinea apprima]
MFVMIVGGGNVGMHLASFLLDQGYKVKIVENRPEMISRLERKLPKEVIVFGSGSDPNVLESADIRHVDVMVAATGQDETNLVVSSLAKLEFGVPRVIGRVNNPLNAWLYTIDMGVDVALNQAELIGTLVAEQMSLGDMMTLLRLRKGKFSIVEEKVAPGAPADGKALKDIKFPNDCTITAVIRDGSLIVPHGDTILQTTDEVLALVSTEQIPVLAALLGKPIK